MSEKTAAITSAGALRMAQHRDHRRNWLRFITIELRESKIDRSIGLSSRHSRNALFHEALATLNSNRL
jgi:hypothetical protein